MYSKHIKKSCPRVLKGCWNEERGFCFEVLVLKFTCVRILMLVAGGTDISADVRMLKSASPLWWSLLSCSFILHLLYLAHTAGVCACFCRCGQPDIYELFVIAGGYRSQKAAQKQLWAIIVRRERSVKELVAEGFGKEVSWQLQNSVTFFCVNNRMS